MGFKSAVAARTSFVIPQWKKKNLPPPSSILSCLRKLKQLLDTARCQMCLQLHKMKNVLACQNASTIPFCICSIGANMELPNCIYLPATCIKKALGKHLLMCVKTLQQRNINKAPGKTLPASSCIAGRDSAFVCENLGATCISKAPGITLPASSCIAWRDSAYVCENLGATCISKALGKTLPASCIAGRDLAA